MHNDPNTLAAAATTTTTMPKDIMIPITGSSESSNDNEQQTSTREHGSVPKRHFDRWVRQPIQRFGIYLASPHHERSRLWRRDTVNDSTASDPTSSANPSRETEGLKEGYSSAEQFFYRHLPPWLFPQFRSKRLVVRSTLLRPFCRFVILWLILVVLIAATIVYSFRPGQVELSDYNAVTEFDWEPIQPQTYLSPMVNASSFAPEAGGYNILLDGHSHSVYSDGRMSPEVLLKWHIANGYNAVVVSDHNTIRGGLAAQKVAFEKYNDTITVIPAMELTTCRFHMNLIGINETIDIALKKWPTDEEIKAAIDRTHALGGLAIINHIPWSNTTEYGYQLPRMQHHPSREKLVELGIDGIEVLNGDTLDTISLKFIQDNNLILMTGVDVHYPDSHAYSWTILRTADGNRSMESIMAEFCHEASFRMRWGVIGYFIAWVIIGFLLFEAARLIVVGCCWGPIQRRRKFKKEQQRHKDKKAAGNEPERESEDRGKASARHWEDNEDGQGRNRASRGQGRDLEDQD
ncbi:hypothetical protein BGW38_001625 [Lunasporangiospora selenospora]|uniref:Polymerase/histidinol phosphatase N-terminal domain-containing protein n=1 Tax=Lunasporangiospora selenospora TaxID=979761 RepID=A0A9P6FTQ5_9FUNG|nr:hypothetical protein BGW38_001625 [Lunasporangiospora selenospora]